MSRLITVGRDWVINPDHVSEVYKGRDAFTKEDMTFIRFKNQKTKAHPMSVEYVMELINGDRIFGSE